MNIVTVLALAAVVAPIIDIVMRYISFRKSITAITSTSTFLATDEDVTNILKVVYVPGKNFPQNEISPIFDIIETPLKQVGDEKYRLEYVILPRWQSIANLKTTHYFNEVHLRRISSIFNETGKGEVE